MTSQGYRFIIGVDAGGTKTIARLINLSNHQVMEFKTTSGSLTNDTRAATETIYRQLQEVVDKGKVDPESTVLVIGAAGAENHQNAEVLLNRLNEFNWRRLTIKSDAYISLMGAAAGKAGVVVAIGTGSVAMKLASDGTITQYGGWGFRVGDQGSGAHLGRALVIEALKAFDRGEISSPLMVQTFAVIGNNRQDILRWVKAASPRDFAELMTLIAEHRHQDKLAKQLLDSTIQDIEELIHLARGDSDLPVYLTGGLGRKIYPHLPSFEYDWLSLAQGDAIDGAIRVARNEINVSPEANTSSD